MVLLFIVSLLALPVWYLYYLITKNNDYFHEKPIPSMVVRPLFGSTASLVLKKCSFNDFIMTIYRKYPSAKVFGLFDATTPIFVIRDPELIKKITVKDFDHFVDHRPIFGTSDNNQEYTLFAQSLFAMNGDKWRNMRATLSPAFTGSKMRQMFDLIIECCDSTAQYHLKKANASQEIDLSDLYTRFGSDVIASCAFGIKMDSFRDSNNPFYENGKKMMRFDRFSVALRIFLNKFCPKLMGSLGIDIIDYEQAKYFSDLIMSAIRDRQIHNTVRSDMINLLIEAQKGILRHQQEKESEEGYATAQESDIGKANVSITITDSEMVAQAFVFFLAGFETVATTLMFMTHDLVVNPDVQQKLYEEIVETEQSLGGKNLNYDTLQKMKYLDQVVSESMRMRPAASILDRICIRDYILDDGEGLRFSIEKGTAIWIPSQGLHMDEKYFPNPEIYDPDRFSRDRSASINPFTYLPFGTGPRNCIGSRFALMEMKAIIYYLLLHFSFVKTARTQIPLKLRKGHTIVAVEGELFVELKKRN